MKHLEAPSTSALASTLNPLTPLMDLWKATEWLTDYFRQEPPNTPGDDWGTCYASYAAVMLSAIVIGTESPVVLSGVTSYPAPFTAAVCNSMRRQNLWHAPDVLYLRTFLKLTPKDWRILPGVLDEAMLKVWNTVACPDARIALESLRRGVLFGGDVQRWLDADAAAYFALM